MTIQEHVAIGSKTTMKIGGTARYYAELFTKEDVEEAVKFAHEKSIPLIPFGGGSNTVFADGEVNALVVRMKAEAMTAEGNRVTVQAGKILGSFLNELAAKNLDLSALTGIPGTIGGAIFGNAGQGLPRTDASGAGVAGGIWIDSFVESVTAYVNGEWKNFSKDECKFRYRESIFKDLSSTPNPSSSGGGVGGGGSFVIIWEVVLNIPSRPEAEVKADIERLLQKRIETQPHLKTAGSCFKSLPDGTPAWKLIDAAGLRGTKIGDVQIAKKHANFLLNLGKATFEDVMKITGLVQKVVPQIAGVEMRLYGTDGKIIQAEEHEPLHELSLNEMSIADRYLPEENAPHIDRELLKRYTQNKTTPEESARVKKLITAFRSWHEAYVKIKETQQGSSFSLARFFRNLFQ